MAFLFDDAHILKKTVQLGVHFTPSVDAEADREMLAAFAKQVRALDNRVFNRYAFNRTSPSGQQAALLFERDMVVPKVGQAHNTPLLVYANWMEIALIYRIPEARGVEMDSQERPRDEDFNKMVRLILREFWAKVASVDITRIGKVYEYVWGPFEDDGIGWVTEKFLKVPAEMTVVGGNAFYLFRQEGHNINFLIAPGTSPLGPIIQTKLDINNIDNTQRLQQPELDGILAFATRFHQENMQKLLQGG